MKKPRGAGRVCDNGAALQAPEAPQAPHAPQALQSLQASIAGYGPQAAERRAGRDLDPAREGHVVVRERVPRRHAAAHGPRRDHRLSPRRGPLRDGALHRRQDRHHHRRRAHRRSSSPSRCSASCRGRGSIDDFTILENNCTQSIATAAGYMVTPIVSGLAAYMMVTGHHRAVVADDDLQRRSSRAIGVLVAFPMKRRFINDDQLPFPEGRAAGVVLDALYTGEAAAGMFRAKLLVVTAVLHRALPVPRRATAGCGSCSSRSCAWTNGPGSSEPWHWRSGSTTTTTTLAAKYEALDPAHPRHRHPAARPALHARRGDARHRRADGDPHRDQRAPRARW